MALDTRITSVLFPLLTQSTTNNLVIWFSRSGYYQTGYFDWLIAIKRTDAIVAVIIYDRKGTLVAEGDVDDAKARALHDAVVAQSVLDPSEVSLTQLIGTRQLDRVFLPVIWQKKNVTANQTTGVPMDIVGLAIKQLPLSRNGSLMSVGVVLSTAVTAGFIRLEMTRDGVATGKTLDITSATGTKRVWEFAANELIGTKGQDLGVNWGSNAALLPTNTIELNVFFEVQWCT